MNKKLSIVLLMAFVMTLSFAIGGCNKTTADTVSPIITVSKEIPTAGINGKEVTLPSATARDEKDGDLTNAVKLTVNALDESGQVKAEPIFNKAANVERTFAPSSRYASYKIIYFVADAAGNKAEKVVDFVATNDTQAPVLTLEEGFDIVKGITARADESFTLPKAQGVDKPCDDVMSDKINIAILSATGGKVKDFKDGAIAHTARIIAGEYTCEYSLMDGAENEATKIIFPIRINAADYSSNLLKPENIVLGNSAEMDEYNWLKVGLTSKSNKTWDSSNAAMNLVKIKDEYVSVRFNIDKPSIENPEFMYQIGAVGSQSSTDYLPNADYPWHSNMFIRFTQEGMTIYSDSTSSAGNSETFKTNFFDGNDHTLMFKMNFNDSTENTAKSMTLNAWIDVLPTAEPSASLTVTRAEDEVNVKASKLMAKTEFDRLFASSGWLNFMSYLSGAQNVTCGDDKMLVKGIAVYPKNETQFALSLNGPTFALDGSFLGKYIVGSEVNVPIASWVNAVAGSAFRKLYIDDQAVTLAETAVAYTFNTIGMAKLVYGAKDNNGFYEIKTFEFKIIADDKIAPVITVDKTDIAATLGAEFNIPTVTAQDNIDGDISSKLSIFIDGVSYKKNLTSGEAVTLKAEGVHYINYIVEDEAGNKTIERVKVTVSKSDSTKGAGNILVTDTAAFTGAIDAQTKYLTIPQGTVTASYNGEYIYNKKVSMVINTTASANGIMLLNIRGESAKTEWLNGLVLSIQSGKICVSYGSWTANTYGTANKSFAAVALNTDALLEFNTTDISVDSVDYVLLRVWVNREELIFTADASKGGVVGANGGIMVAKSKLGAAQYAGNLIISVPSPIDYAFAGVIKEIRIDGTESDFVVPTPKPEIPTFDTPTVTTTTATVTSSGQQLLSGSGNNETITMKISSSTYDKVRLMGVMILGAPDANKDWLLNGIGIRLWEGNLSLTYGTHNMHFATKYNAMDSYVDGKNINMYLSYTVAYNYDPATNLLSSIRITVYTGSSADNMTKVQFGSPSTNNPTKDKTTFSMDDGVLVTAANMKELTDANTTPAFRADWFKQAPVTVVATAGPQESIFNISEVSVKAKA